VLAAPLVEVGGGGVEVVVATVLVFGLVINLRVVMNNYCSLTPK